MAWWNLLHLTRAAGSTTPTLSWFCWRNKSVFWSNNCEAWLVVIALFRFDFTKIVSVFWIMVASLFPSNIFIKLKRFARKNIYFNTKINVLWFEKSVVAHVSSIVISVILICKQLVVGTSSYNIILFYAIKYLQYIFTIICYIHHNQCTVSWRLQLRVQSLSLVLSLGILDTNRWTLQIIEPCDSETSWEATAWVDHQWNLCFSQTWEVSWW